jgi:tRNA (guanine37-N1)-methyltransferase
MERLLGIFVQAQEAQRTLELLRRMKLQLNGFRFHRVGEEVGIPLVRLPSAQDENMLRTELEDFRIQETSFEPALSRPRNLRDAVRAIVPPNLLSDLPRSLDVVGDIAILEISPRLEPYSLEVGKGILQVNPHVRLVLKKTSDVTGAFRTRGLQVLAGSGGMETIHREFGCDYHLDTSSVYFNPRLAHERLRVAAQAAADDVVVDMFAGVGPYSILIAKLQPHSTVYALDINPSAIKYLKENILANGVADRVVALLGDARVLSRSVLQGTADRVVMNLPSEAEHYLDAACQILKPAKSYIHFYRFAPRGVNLDSVKDDFERSVLSQNRKIRTFSYCDVVREISPRRVQIAIDALVK